MIKFVFTLLLCFIFHSQVSAHVLQLYGLTPGGGSRGQGNIFKINSDGTGYEEKFAFDSLTGFEAWGTLIQASDGLLLERIVILSVVVVVIIRAYDIIVRAECIIVRTVDIIIKV